MGDQAGRTTATHAIDFNLPTPEAGRAEARSRLAATFRQGERVWLLSEQYGQEQGTSVWVIDILIQGSNGRWMRRRYRFDEQAHVLHFLGEHALNDAEFRAARRSATIFPSAGV